MKISKSLTGTVLCAVLAACAAATTKPAAVLVPPALVPAGSESKDCHLESSEQHDSGGWGSMDTSGGGVGAIAAADHGGGTRGQVKCHRTTQILPQRSQCFDGDGQEHPVQWCKDREAARDTASAKPSS